MCEKSKWTHFVLLLCHQRGMFLPLTLIQGNVTEWSPVTVLLVPAASLSHNGSLNIEFSSFQPS